MSDISNGGKLGVPHRVRGRCLMVQGTSSHAGKSVITAALCRILRQDGFKVAPFKAQNMSLNSWVTPEGGEISRAQALQAQAAGIEPHTDMNPILLKPSGDARSQLVLEGKPEGTYTADEYYRMRDELFPRVLAALERLRSRFQVVIIEGAGSPAEINLAHRDMANMALAQAVGAPVLLVADIDRGGVFASVVGTLELLPRRQRELVRGVIINQFRGDPRLLRDGLDMLERRTGIPVLGVVPFLHNLGLDEEDSMGLEERVRGSPGAAHREEGTGREIKVAVLRLPRLSNATDFQPLEAEKGVRVVYATYPRDLEGADAIIIPGTKNTAEDLRFLRERGLDHAILGAAINRKVVIGICGGYQMLGFAVRDPLAVESGLREVEGLGLLPLITEMTSEKAIYRVRAAAHKTVPCLGIGRETPTFEAYEIHMGISTVFGSQPLVILERGGRRTEIPEGAMREDLPVFGCYLHGLFDDPLVRRGFLGALGGVGRAVDDSSPAWNRLREERLKRLAEAVRSSLDVESVYNLLGLEGSHG